MKPYYIIQRTKNFGKFEVIDYLTGYKDDCILFSMFKSDALAFDKLNEAFKYKNNLQSMHIKDDVIHKFNVIIL
jgi:hypothetical protein